MIENLVDGKMYIGSASVIHDRLIHHRWCLNNGRHENNHLQNAWDKYGEDNFRFVPLFECEERERVGKLGYEQAFFDLIWGYLYNINPVAELMTPTRAVCSWDKNKNFLKRYDSLASASRDTGAHVSAISKVCKGKLRTSAGFFWTYDNEELVVSPPRKNIGSNPSCPCSYNNDGIEFKKFYSYSEAAKSFNGSSATIAAACSGRARTAYGYFWACGDDKPHIYESSNCKKRVGKYKNGELIKTFDSATAASRDVGSTRSNMSRICRGLSGGDYGFDWKYLD